MPIGRAGPPGSVVPPGESFGRGARVGSLPEVCIFLRRTASQNSVESPASSEGRVGSNRETIASPLETRIHFLKNDHDLQTRMSAYFIDTGLVEGGDFF